MSMRIRVLALFGLNAVLGLGVAGCGSEPAPQAPAVSDSSPSTATTPVAGTASAPNAFNPATEPPKRTFRPVTIGGAGSEASGAGGSKAAPKSSEAKVDSVLQAMKPLQMVLISDWHGISRKTKQQEELNWKWDLRTNREQPALVMTFKDGHYFQKGRMTWLPEEENFRLNVTDTDGTERVYKGEFEEPVRDVLGDDNKMQRTYKLRFTQIAPADDPKLAAVVFHQQENNRYLMELFDKRGMRMQQVDVIGNQREGSSFAFNDSDYDDKTCIVSQGLGTMSVSHKGQTYYVCCTGCKAAFDEDPERWIAKLAERAAK